MFFILFGRPPRRVSRWLARSDWELWALPGEGAPGSLSSRGLSKVRAIQVLFSSSSNKLWNLRGALSMPLVISVWIVLQVCNVNQCHRVSGNVIWNLIGSLEESESPSRRIGCRAGMHRRKVKWLHMQTIKCALTTSPRLQPERGLLLLMERKEVFESTETKDSSTSFLSLFFSLLFCMGNHIQWRGKGTGHPLYCQSWSLLTLSKHRINTLSSQRPRKNHKEFELK